MLLAWPPLLVLHELGHAVVAHALGWRVYSIVIGFGRTLLRFRYRHVDMEIRLIPLEGFVRTAPRDLVRPQLKSALIYFAGPGVELVLALLILLIVGPAQFFIATNQPGMIATQSLVLAAVLGAVLNLLPHSTETASGSAVSDGLGIFLSLFTPTEEFARQMHRTRDSESR